jgi:pimeloyl-ACP methyl ester carboxylesterase
VGAGARDSNAPDTVVLIHGLWMTPLSWEHWVKRYTDRGFKVVAKSWPRMDLEIEELRRNPDRLADLSVSEIVEHYEKIIRMLDRPPIIMGHSFGGLFTQILIDRGLGAAGVAIASAPVKGILLLPFSTLKSSFPALSNPFNYRRAAPLSPDQFHYAFGDNLSEADSRLAYNRYAVPGPDHVLFQAALANFNPHAPTAVNFHNDTRAPLLLVSGGRDHIAPTELIRMNFNLYQQSKAVTEMKDYPNRSHYTLGEPGWEEVADDAVDWALTHAMRTASAGVKL